MINYQQLLRRKCRPVPWSSDHSLNIDIYSFIHSFITHEARDAEAITGNEKYTDKIKDNIPCLAEQASARQLLRYYQTVRWCRYLQPTKFVISELLNLSIS